jgi:hypothetical protein
VEVPRSFLSTLKAKIFLVGADRLRFDVVRLLPAVVWSLAPAWV